MKRKTNLFYLSGNDSKFITFSNYSESLTGNFLATDWKLFPSKFLCLYVKVLDTNNPVSFNSRKSEFIKYIASYYENKMAFLRDYCISNNINLERTLLPLNYLLEAIYRLPNDFDYKLREYTDIQNSDDVEITFVGDITEQDYNGTYTDTINVIHSGDYAKGKIIVEQKNDDYAVPYTDIKNNDKYNLYGWVEKNAIYNITDYTGPSEYKDVEPVFDTDDKYYISSCITGISTDLHESSKNIKFNILIPLYDLIDINSSTNTVNLVEDEKITIGDVEQNGIDLTNTGTNYIKNVPMGIWFSEEVVELKRDITTGYSPSWSLLLSSQFKPFPYSRKIPNEITQDSTKEAYATYSQVLIRQNKLLDKLEDMSEQISTLNKRIDLFESKLNTIGTAYTVDKMHTELINFENHTEHNFDLFKKEIYAYITNNWKGYIS